MAMPRESMLVRHGFGSLGACGASGDPFDEEPVSEEGAVWYNHGYVDAWGLSGRWDPLAEGALAANRIGESPDAECFEQPTDIAQEESLIHGEEAAAWSALGRRALLRRVEED